MGNFIENPLQISKIDTIIKTRYSNMGNFYDDLFLTVYFGFRKKRDYIIHSDLNYTVNQIKNIIDNRLDSDDVMISESDRKYLYLRVGGNGVHRITGRRYYPDSILDPANNQRYI
ncbi:hypothetical protein [Aliarcobacter butzleri]|uniref:hypothetical protein n=1 Tax=Aliarcobacter butzleri TaxID=28197 RepID=UPI0024DE4FC4|nr:hypothetical protein [Aliarcobacter butzleri]MDK2050571.1 hypothetical protein [Aliarcobacter butzleri]